MDVGNPEKDGDEPQGGEDGVAEREGNDGGTGETSGGRMTRGDVQTISVGEFEPKAYKANEGKQRNAESHIEGSVQTLHYNGFLFLTRSSPRSCLLGPTCLRPPTWRPRWS